VRGHVVVAEQLLRSSLTNLGVGGECSIAADATVAGRPVVAVIDMAGLGLRHCSPTAVSCFKELSQLDDAMYPELLAHVFVSRVV
jgi:hypothetical protein